MEAEIIFENEGRSGIVATGTYIFDAAKRLGVVIEDECGRRGECDLCKVKILSGKNHLTEPTKAEIKILDAEQLIQGYRLSCQTKIQETGEIKIMTEKKKEPEKTEEEKAKEAEQKVADDFRKQFEKLPLEEKMSVLLDLEGIAFGETVSFVMNSPYKLVDKVMDFMADHGLKMEKDEKNQKRPEEHKTEADSSDAKVEPEAKPKRKTSRAKKTTEKSNEPKEEK